MICFLVLMQNGDGLIDKSPDYIAEKTRMLRAGYDAFAYLDIHNMRKALQWCVEWGVGAPESVQDEMNLQNIADTELRNKGFSI